MEDSYGHEKSAQDNSYDGGRQPSMYKIRKMVMPECRKIRNKSVKYIVIVLIYLIIIAFLFLKTETISSLNMFSKALVWSTVVMLGIISIGLSVAIMSVPTVCKKALDNFEKHR